MSERFPTLAEELEELPAGDDARATGLLVLVDHAAGADVAAVVPEGSLVLGAGARDEAATDRADRRASTLQELRAVVETARMDLLLVRTGTSVTRPMVEALRRSLSTDSACATVSIAAELRPLAPGIPAESVERPAPGAVLVRRDHLLLALADPDDVVVSRASVSPGDLVGELLARLEHPGFVHRAFSLGGGESRAPAVPTPRNGRRDPDVVIDGRSLAFPLAGTQVQLVGLLGGLVRAGRSVTVALSGDIHPSARSELGHLVDEVRFVDRGRVGRPLVLHMPHQFWSLRDLAESLATGERLVVTQLDMIAERTPAYRSERSRWLERRELTAAVFSSADQIGFLSRHAALDAASDGALDLARATVVHCGVDHLFGRTVPDPARPLGGRAYLLVVGSSYWHKNRLFALRMLRWLADTHGWDGGLVLAGGHPEEGSSVPAERRLLDKSPELAERVVDLGHVSERERLALYAGAELVLFPSYFEGFGFVPFESAALGTACAYAYRSSMRELLPATGALPSFDLDEAGPFIVELLEGTERRKAIVDQINAAASGLTWERTAAGYLEVYERALASEPRGVSRLLLALVPEPARTLRTESEVLLVDVYRRRRGFRLAADVAVHGGQRAVRVGRRLRRRLDDGSIDATADERP